LTLESDIELIGDVPIFADLSEDQLRLLAFSSVRRDLKQGDVLFHRGDAARSGFVVDTGAIDLTVREEDGRLRRESCRRGCLIGEVPLFVDAARPSDAKARGACSVLEISRQMMNRMLQEYPEVAELLYRKLAERIAGTLGELQRVRETLLAIDG
jgi:CRP-like cAMP-binding protein